ncbi:MAG TPA: glycosyltransferase [Burkholderiaceae bacterium]|nr:glycosyltransferase [Burkholderiaceae bacterium]
MRVAVVTPYHREPPHYLRRCVDSVRQQTHPGVEHFLVADGHPQDWLDAEPVRHLKLDRAHGDYGNTPRAVGAMLAASEGFDAICFLDADNWYHPDHVLSCVEVARTEAPDYVATLRYLAREDGTILPLGIGEDVSGEHIDTNCYFFCRGAFHTLSRWALMPRPMAALGDRFFLQSLRAEGLRAASTGCKTVHYLCTWAHYFRLAGEEPPPYAKEAIQAQPTLEWIKNLSPEDAQIVRRLTGVAVGPAAARS